MDSSGIGVFMADIINSKRGKIGVYGLNTHIKKIGRFQGSIK